MRRSVSVLEVGTITLYGFGRVHRQVIGETRDLRVEWALEEAGLPYRVHALDPHGGRTRRSRLKPDQLFPSGTGYR